MRVTEKVCVCVCVCRSSPSGAPLLGNSAVFYFDHFDLKGDPILKSSEMAQQF